jgi:acetolactate synthase small subunit
MTNFSLYRFTVTAKVDSEVLPRICGLFASLGITPLALEFSRDHTSVKINISIDGLNAHVSARFGHRIAKIFSVTSVVVKQCSGY